MQTPETKIIHLIQRLPHYKFAEETFKNDKLTYTFCAISGLLFVMAFMDRVLKKEESTYLLNFMTEHFGLKEKEAKDLMLKSVGAIKTNIDELNLKVPYLCRYLRENFQYHILKDIYRSLFYLAGTDSDMAIREKSMLEVMAFEFGITYEDHTNIKKELES